MYSGAFVVLPEFIWQASVGIGANQCIRDAADVGNVRAKVFGAEGAIKPDCERRACRTECQKASGNWPDSNRPDLSVMVPETITGT